MQRQSFEKTFCTFHKACLTLFSLALAVPLSWWMMDKWLANFAYHIEVQWWMFAIAGLLTFGIAFLTVGAQSLKAALG